MKEFGIRVLDRLASTEISLFRRTWPAYQFCGGIGLVLAIVLAMLLVAHLSLSTWVMAAIIISAIITFLGLVMITKILTGEERIIYYHHEIAVMIVAALLLWGLGQPVLPYLDATILGIGIFLACGRIGCFMVGCCHGRPQRWGVCYRQEHADAGFTSYYVGVRLFPIQLVESISVLAIVIVGANLVLHKSPAGTALTWYVVAYDLVRFSFEFMRGDPERPYYLGFSQPQWISLILMLLVVGAELHGILRLQIWHIGATAFLAISMVVVTFRRQWAKSPKHRVWHPRHVKEVAEAIELASNSAVASTFDSLPTTIPLARTASGANISAGRIENGGSPIQHYALSLQNELMTEKAARILADLILLLKHASNSHELVKGDRGVFHLLVYRG